jgi:hypothetical protein
MSLGGEIFIPAPYNQQLEATYSFDTDYIVYQFKKI